MALTSFSSRAQAEGPLSAYKALVAGGELTADSAQHDVAVKLQGLFEAIKEGSGRIKLPFFRGQEEVRGMYLWGNVGRGKSMLMDLFFTHAPIKQKRRVHFHRFMQEVHARIHEIRKESSQGDVPGDPVALLVQQLAKEVKLLCFDELQATDVADASLLYRLFDGLFEADVIIVSTSNHPPANLYTGGVQKERFDRWIELIEEKMDVVSLSSPTDYRTQQLKSMDHTYHTPLGRDADAFVEETIHNLAPGAKKEPVALLVQGRTVKIAGYGSSVAVASFAELCEKPLGPADYLSIADEFKTVILTGIPVLTPEKRNEAKRFVTLIDALYENKVKLIATAAAPPETLYPHGDGSFEFKRTVSRLKEMQSERYLAGEGD